MRDADQLARGIARQLRIRIERDDVADARQRLAGTDRGGEAGIGGAAQQAIEFFQLAALALPSHPHLLALVPQALAVQKRKKRSGPRSLAAVAH